MFKKAFGVLQKVGKALMLPVALLPAAGLLLGIGNALQQETTLQYLPFLDVNWIQLIASVMEDSGGIVFDNLPLIFAAGVAIGLAGDGAAALAAAIAARMAAVADGSTTTRVTRIIVGVAVANRRTGVGPVVVAIVGRLGKRGTCHPRTGPRGRSGNRGPSRTAIERTAASASAGGAAIAR